jgi:hypothetical protein
LEPHVDDGDLTLIRDVVTFKGLPTPTSGHYTIHINDNEYSTSSVEEIATHIQHEDHFYDLYGRILKSKPTNGFYIRNGQKIYAK